MRLILKGQPIASFQNLIADSNQEHTTFKIKKKVTPGNSIEEQKFILKLHEQLQNKITSLRTNRICARSQIKFNPNNQKIEILKQIGKCRFRSSGETNFCKILFQLEMNHVELYRRNILLSLEEVYCLILNENKSKIFKKFIIYSMLTRAGFTIKPHNENADYCDEQSYIWQNLFQRLGVAGKDNSCFEFKKMEEIQKYFELIKERTICSENQASNDLVVQTNNENIIFKRKFPIEKSTDKEEPSRKKIKYKNFSEETNNRIQNIFDTIKIKNVPNPSASYNHIRTYKISPDFDLYLNNGNSGPDFRILIIDKKFPKIDDLCKCYWRLKLKLPLICVNVEDTRNIQTFLLYFN